MGVALFDSDGHRRVWVVATLWLGLAACRTPLAALDHRTELTTQAGSFTLRFANRDRRGAEGLKIAVARAAPALERWGGLRVPVSMEVMPTHAMLEEAVDKHGYGWLRAWARYDEVYVQSPRSWSFFGATQPDLDEVLLHELTHCVMYQQSATRTSWRRKEIPPWFREGMASYTARQGYRWPTMEDLAQYLSDHEDLAPLLAAEGYRDQSELVYGAAHHAFTFLARRYGEDKVRGVLSAMSEGRTFPEAFAAVIGMSVPQFVQDFQRYIRFRGFRGGRLLIPRPPEPAPEPAAPP